MIKNKKSEEDHEAEADDSMETRSSTKRSRTMKYGQEEDIVLCFAWMNVPTEAAIGKDQTEDKFCSRTEDYYCNNVTTHSRALNAHFLDHTSHHHNSQWFGCVNQVNHAPPSGVQLTMGHKQRNKKGSGKAFTLHHCYKELLPLSHNIRTFFILE